MWHDQFWNGPPLWGWGLPMALFRLLPWLALVLLVRRLIRNRPTAEPDTRLQILQQRLARGEINAAEFDALYRKLHDSPPLAGRLGCNPSYRGRGLGIFREINCFIFPSML